MSKSAKKQAYFSRLVELFSEYDKLFLVDLDMVGSKQVQNVRMSIRGKGEMLMGKNTMIRKCMRMHMEDFPQFETLLPHVQGNRGFIFIKDDMDAVQEVINANFVAAAARAGALAPIDVNIPKGVTTLQPTETAFFQALNISTKISKGCIEILQDVELVKAGSKVSPGAATLMQKLNLKPFTYGPVIKTVFENGEAFDSAILDIKTEDILSAFSAGIAQVAALCLGAAYPTVASIPHSFVNGYKNVLSIALATDYTYPQCAELKALLSDPEALAKLAAASAAPAAATDAPADAAPAAVEEEDDDEEEDDMDFDLFD